MLVEISNPESSIWWVWSSAKIGRAKEGWNYKQGEGVGTIRGVLAILNKGKMKMPYYTQQILPFPLLFSPFPFFPILSNTHNLWLYYKASFLPFPCETNLFIHPSFPWKKKKKEEPASSSVSMFYLDSDY